MDATGYRNSPSQLFWSDDSDLGSPQEAFRAHSPPRCTSCLFLFVCGAWSTIPQPSLGEVVRGRRRWTFPAGVHACFDASRIG